MNPPRFHVAQALALGTELELPTSVAHHAARVLRLRDGAPIVLFNGTGGEYRARIALSGKRTHAAIEAFDPIEREAPLQVTLLQAMVAADKLDWIVEKAVELGVARVLIMRCERDVVRLQGERLQRRLTHLREIVVAACCQCGRNRLPAVGACDSLHQALTQAPRPGFLLIPEYAAPALNANDAAEASIVVGPEGGFTDVERGAARSAGFAEAQLGPRILRTETAGLAALATLQARCRTAA